MCYIKWICLPSLNLASAWGGVEIWHSKHYKFYITYSAEMRCQNLQGSRVHLKCCKCHIFSIWARLYSYSNLFDVFIEWLKNENLSCHLETGVIYTDMHFVCACEFLFCFCFWRTDRQTDRHSFWSGWQMFHVDRWFLSDGVVKLQILCVKLSVIYWFDYWRPLV